MDTSIFIRVLESSQSLYNVTVCADINHGEQSRSVSDRQELQTDSYAHYIMDMFVVS